MSFLELHNKIVQTKKARNGKKNAIDYFENEEDEEFYRDVYKKALNAANYVVKYYDKKKKIEPFVILWEKPQKEKERELEKKNDEYLKMAAEYEKLWKDKSEELRKATDEVEALKIKVRSLESALKKSNIGGRYKDKEKEDRIVVYKHTNPKASVREIAEALKVSKDTVQKALVAHNLNNSRKK